MTEGHIMLVSGAFGGFFFGACFGWIVGRFSGIRDGMVLGSQLRDEGLRVDPQ